MIDPIASFKKRPDHKTWVDAVDSELFHAAASAAILQMTLMNSLPPDMATASAYQMKMEGAKQFLALLMKLTDPLPAPPAMPGRNNLNHRI